MTNLVNHQAGLQHDNVHIYLLIGGWQTTKNCDDNNKINGVYLLWVEASGPQKLVTINMKKAEHLMISAADGKKTIQSN